jgi:hypothetical protein
MTTSEKIYTFAVRHEHGATLVEAQQWPWTVVQVISTTTANRDGNLDTLKQRHDTFAVHDYDNSFVVVHVGGGTQGGRHPDRSVDITQDNYRVVYQAICDQVAQAAVWYKTNVIDAAKNHLL